MRMSVFLTLVVLLVVPLVVANKSMDRCVANTWNPYVSEQFALYNITAPCVFEDITRSSSVLSSLSESGKIRVSERNSIPDSQGWSRCENCFFDTHAKEFKVYTRAQGDRGQVNMDENNCVDRLKLSWSSWGEFFYWKQKDQYSVCVVPISTPDTCSSSGEGCGKDQSASLFSHYDVNTYFYLYVDRPAFLLPLITIHPGHVLIDLLEQLYWSMMDAYGRIRRDALLIIDVAGQEESGVLKEKLVLHTAHYMSKLYGISGKRYNTITNLLELFSDLPVFSTDLLYNFSIPILDTDKKVMLVFKDIHIGLDNSKAFYSENYEYYPCLFSSRSTQVHYRYRQFQQYLLSQYGYIGNRDGNNVHIPRRMVHILIVQRSSYEDNKNEPGRNNSASVGNRVLLNAHLLEEMIMAHFNTAGDIPVNVTTQILENLPFSVQLAVFQQTDILIAAAGSALHNVLFMKSGSAVIMVMQPGWCEWSWMYENQALMLGINTFVYCHNDNNDNDHMKELSYNYMFTQWTRSFWKQPPLKFKNDDISLDLKEMGLLVHQALLMHRKSKRRDQVVGVGIPHGVEGKTCHRRVKPQSSLWPSLQSQVNSKVASISVLQTFVSTCTLSAVNHGDNNDYMVSILGEFAFLPNYEHYYESIQGLSLCLVPLYTAMQEPWCTPLEAYNYYSELQFVLKIEPLRSKMLYIHLWLQSSPHGGKVKHSDNFVTMNLQVASNTTTLDTFRGKDDECGLYVYDSLASTERDGNESLSASFVDMRMNVSSFLYKSMQQCRIALEVEQEQNNGSSSDCTSDAVRQLLLDRPETLYRYIAILRDKEDFVLSPRADDGTIASSDPSKYHHLVFGDKWSTAVQYRVKHYCKVKYTLPNEVCILISELVYRQVILHKKIREKVSDDNKGGMFNYLPSIQYMPSSLRPFVFLHIEKCGGTTIREFIADAMHARHISGIVPCYDGVHCDIINLHDLVLINKSNLLSNASVLAGHFYWNVWNHLNAQVIEGTSVGSVVNMTPSCFIMTRHPVDRAISYYYQRCFNIEACAGYQRRINDLSVAELETLLLSTRHAHTFDFFESDNNDDGRYNDSDKVILLDEGMSDATCRMMIGERHTAGLVLDASMLHIPPPRPLAYQDFVNARRNTLKCIVGLHEEYQQSLHMLTTWFPWIGDFSQDPSKRKMFLYSDKETSLTIKADLYDAIVKHNQCDMELYGASKQQFQWQKQVMQK